MVRLALYYSGVGYSPSLLLYTLGIKNHSIIKSVATGVIEQLLLDSMPCLH